MTPTTHDDIDAVFSKMMCSHAAMQATSPQTREKILHAVADQIVSQKASLADFIVREARKPIQLAVHEVERAALTFRWAARAIALLDPEHYKLGTGTTELSSFEVRLVPRGPVVAITPFNFPLNLVAHKVAPAIAAGTSVLVKPAPQTPSVVLQLKHIYDTACQEHSAPIKDALQVELIEPKRLEPFLNDPRYGILSFTGSTSVGWNLKKLAFTKKVLLELGGTAAVIVASDANIKRAASRIAFGAYAYAGQTCISVQKIYVHDSIYEDFKAALLHEISELPVGEPEDPSVIVGPVIDPKSSQRILEWIGEALDAGAECLTPFQAADTIITPVLLEKTPKTSRLWNEEAFGPVALLEPYHDDRELLETLNASRFGIQGGLFTFDEDRIQLYFKTWELGGLLIDEVPTVRFDQIPYGGVKDSGIGREGPLFALREFCETRTLIR